jgi:hypothetical protein
VAMEEGFVEVLDCGGGGGDTFIDVVMVGFGFFWGCEEGLVD